MPYAISWIDEPEAASLRLELRDAHLDYMRENLARVLASGGLLDDPGEVGLGGLILLDIDTREEAENFVKADPFYIGGVYKNPTIYRWRKAFYDGKALI
ncbi:YciI family protein [Ochrobactrum sp. Q0168]|uniref:YciI family protein n=1 Tax=Ochrobactrum sp. Q0168 TaxID=2793241 RepID=UPI0018EA5F62|nr:YciI family protein [Ochrobactrum sp. Q0168]